MPRRHPPRGRTRGTGAIAASAFRCVGCDARVGESRLACADCWARLPQRVRKALRVPYGQAARSCQDSAYLAAAERAAEFLAEGRELAATGGSAG